MSSGVGGSNRDNEQSFFQSLQTQQTEQQKQQLSQSSEDIEQDKDLEDVESGLSQKDQQLAKKIAEKGGQQAGPSDEGISEDSETSGQTTKTKSSKKGVQTTTDTTTRTTKLGPQQGVAKTAKTTSTAKTTVTPKKLAPAQDMLSSAKSTAATSAMLTSSPASTIPETPKLISPSALLAQTQSLLRSGASEFSEFTEFDKISGPEKYISLVVIMAAVLIAQAKMSSNFWQTLFKEGSEQMQASINLAPAIAHATEEDWDAQADISDSEASMSLAAGITSLAGFALSVGAGALAGPEADEAEGAADEDSSATLSEDTEPAEGEENMEMSDMNESATEGTDETESAASKGAKQATKALSKGKKILSVLQRSMSYSQMFSMLTQGINSTVEYFYKLKIASLQREVGMWKAVESQLQIGVQYYQQGFGRTDNLTQGAEANFKQALDNLGQVASTISSAISQGFNKVV